ncbi:hypothetical protein FOMPIDRAFT_1048098 [Fomitopsis schrenkii]|uniref:Uncharacterized protein n=1 Tax=Fomitopsis schrenkii TaxID=2126942 RepID=S8EBR4_FOMSC|nr:hypothetical protein FOMPIDRAFT_1048098 [Fomitopsis schrenkii]
MKLLSSLESPSRMQARKSSYGQYVAHLEVYRDYNGDIPSINRLLGAIGSSLTDLVEHGSLFEGRQHINLEHNSQLRFLESSVSRRIWDTDGVSWLKNELHSLLTTVAGDALDAVTLHFVAKTAAPWMHSLVDEADTDPRRLHNLLRAPVFHGLRGVELLVEVECSDRHGDAANADSAADLFLHFVSSMRALLAPWEARGILALTPVYWEHPQEEWPDPRWF